MIDQKTEASLSLPLPRRSGPCSPPVEYGAPRDAPSISRVSLPDGSSGWVLTRYQDLRILLTDSRFSADRGLPGFPFVLRDGKRVVATHVVIESFPFPFPGPKFGERGTGESRARQHGAMSEAALDQAAMRKYLLGEFTMRRMGCLRSATQQIVDDCVDTMLAGPHPVNLVAELALPKHSRVMCALFGVPLADRAFVEEAIERVVSRAESEAERRNAVDALGVYLDALLLQKESAPADDLSSRLVATHRRRGHSGNADLVNLAFLLLLSGFEATTSMISLSVLALLENPGVVKSILQDPGMTLNAVDELLRILTVTEIATSRIAVQDVEIHGVVIRAGEAVFGLAHAANHDPEVFERPDEIDVEREDRHHLAFGLGAHKCIGQNLARMELQVVVDRLFRRISGLRLAAPLDGSAFKEDDPIVYGLYTLPVTW